MSRFFACGLTQLRPNNDGSLTTWQAAEASLCGMRSPQTSKSRAPGSTARADERIRQTFGRQPLLVAFTLDNDLRSAEVELTRCPGCGWSDVVYEEILAELAALVDELGDETAELLKGRTFARALH